VDLVDQYQVLERPALSTFKGKRLYCMCRKWHGKEKARGRSTGTRALIKPIGVKHCKHWCEYFNEPSGSVNAKNFFTSLCSSVKSVANVLHKLL
jgi:hypothetical protein